MIKTICLLGTKGERIRPYLIDKGFILVDSSFEPDLCISYCYQKKITKDIIKKCKYGVVNFHPAPLPKYKGRAGYNTAILNGDTEYGVSAHYITDEQFDSGPIIKVNTFPIHNENCHSLEKKTQDKLFELLKEVIEILQKGKVETKENKGGFYLTLKQLEEMKIVRAKDDLDTKIKAFFFPPYSGATVIIKGKSYTLINDDILWYIHELLQKQG